jgi:hypothetical protein
LGGFSVAASGNTVVVGAPGVTIGPERTGDERGAVYVFVKPPNGWANMTETAKLWASADTVDDTLGWSVAISGNTVVAGSGHCLEYAGPGAAYVFVKPSGGWTSGTETAKLTPSDGTGLDRFGCSVSISGNTVVAGAPTSTPFSSPGAAYVFVKPPNGWANMTETAKLTTNMSNAKGLGTSVSVSGNVVAAGTKSYLSTTYVFVKPLTGWKNMFPTAKLSSSYYLKYPVFSVAVDSNTVVAGVPAAGAVGEGAAYVYVMPLSGWTSMTQTAVLTASDGGAGDRLGASVSTLGNTVVLGAPNAAIGGNKSQGAAYVFMKPTSGWANMTETAKVTDANGHPNDDFGFSVVISGGTSPILVVGAPEISTMGKGAAYIF